MQKATHDKIHDLQSQINRIEKIFLVAMTGALMSGMAGVIIVLLQKL